MERRRPAGWLGGVLAAAPPPAWTHDDATTRELARRAAIPRYFMTMKSSVVTSSPTVMGGTPVFAGTRVPVETFLEYIEGGESIDDFLEGFPSVSREQVIAFLEETKARVLAEA